jgi:hypothetical protein
MFFPFQFIFNQKYGIPANTRTSIQNKVSKENKRLIPGMADTKNRVIFETGYNFKIILK